MPRDAAIACVGVVMKCNGKVVKIGWISVSLLLAGPIVGLGVARLSRRSAEAQRPRIELDRTQWDLGTVPVGSQLQARFTVRNSGDRRLVMNEESRNCSCCSSAGQSIIVPPGGQIDFTVVRGTDGLRGLVQKGIQFHTNDPHQPTVTLPLVADLKG